MEEIIITFVFTQVMLIPILGALYIGIRAERMKKEALFYKALTTIQRLRRPY